MYLLQVIILLAFSSALAWRGLETRDWVDIELYNPEKARLWSPPLLNTTWVTSNYGFRDDGFHQGMDIGLQKGAYVFATFDGVIKESRYDYGYGNYIIIAHDNGLETLYGHLDGRVKEGARVKAGQFIGFGGNTGWSTGAHLHFEIRYNGVPLNPADVFDFRKPKNQIRFQWLRIHGASLKQEKNISRR